MLAVGSALLDKHNLAEIYVLKSRQWRSVEPYPFAGKLSFQPVIHVNFGFYIFGGYANDTDTKTIARLDAKTYAWSLSGTINNARRYHNVIYVDSSFLVIGGSGKLKTEKCQLLSSVDRVICTTQEPTLDNYTMWPELILVEDD